MPVLALGLLAAAAPALAQPLRIETPREDRALIPPTRDPATHARDADVYPAGPGVAYDPAFIRELSAPVDYTESTGRAGLSVWTSPSTPVAGATIGQREVSGWPAFGWSITWGGPPAPKRAVRQSP